MVKKRIPILAWLPRYQKEDAIGDLIAGITVALTIVPQSMAYMQILGLSPEYGLYSSYLASLLYVFFGSCRQASLGPTAIMSLLTSQTCGDGYPQCVVLTAFYVGCIELVMAALQLGWVVSFISDPVTVGFTSGAALTIGSSQVKSFLGLSGEKGDAFLSYWKAVFTNIKTIKAGDAVLGGCSLVALLLLRKLKDVKSDKAYLNRIYWLIFLSRNAIVILVTSLIAYLWQTPPFKLVGTVQGGFPPIGLPEFELSHRPEVFENGTVSEPEGHYSFWDTWSFLSSGPVVIALVCVLQNVAISKSFGAGQPVDATQEMLALGAANLMGGFFSAVPISAAFSRSAVNEASGVRTPLGGLYTGIIVLLSLNFLTTGFYWIPKSSLAAVIIGAVIFMIDYDKVLPMWRLAKMEAVICIITFIASLVLGMEYGILIGCTVSIGTLLLKYLHPEISSASKTDPSTGTDYLLVKPSKGLIFPSVDHLSTTVQKLTLKNKECSVVIIDFENWTESDFTAANTLTCLEKGLRKNGKVVGFLHCNEAWVRVLKIGGMANPPVVPGMGDLPQFLQGKKLKGSGLAEVVAMEGPNLKIKGTKVELKGDGTVEGVGAISMASTSSEDILSGTDVTSMASSTRAILNP